MSTNAQEVSGDIITTGKGDLIIHPILHSTFVMQWNGLTLYIDPYGGAEKFEGTPDADIILITDIHRDHYDISTLGGLNTSKTTILAPQAVAELMPEDLKMNLVIIGNGEKKSLRSVDIEAIPMYNLPETEDSRHTKGRGNGYVLTLGGKRIYISGDTEDIPEMRALKDIDVAFVCMNMPYTMEVAQAANAVLEFKPKIVYPFHYRGGGGKFADVEKFKKMVFKDPKIEVRLREWYGE